MITYFILSLKRRWVTSLIICSIILILGFGYIGTQMMTQGIVISAQEDLEEHWRWQYDILVYPKESQEYQGLGDGWVAPQTSLASYGGISLEDLETIKQIPGVEVAAPLSLIGYMDYDKVSATYEPVQTGEIYLTEHVKKVFDGLREVDLWSERLYREYIEPDDKRGFFRFENFVGSQVSNQNQALSQYLRTPNKLMIVAVDPQAEESLYRLSEAIVEGEDLLFAEVVQNQALNQPVIPVIALHDLGIQAEESVHVYRVEPPEDNDSWRESDHPADYLDSFPKSLVGELRMNPYSPNMRYNNIHITFSQKGIDEKPYVTSFGPRLLWRYSPIQFEIVAETEYEIPMLYAEGSEQEKLLYTIGENVEGPDKEKIMMMLGEFASYLVYREEIEIDQDQFAFGMDIIGKFDSSLIEPQYASSWQPGDLLDLYTPQHSMILADGAGNPVDPRPLVPLPMKDAYYTGAPDALTTMEAVSIFYGEAPPISSIRVVVSGVEERSEESQKKIEQVATEIMDKTGHNVEIMLGSSAGKVHIQLGGAGEGEIGLVEEGWQKKGVSWEIEEQISVANKWLFIYLAVIIFVLSYTVITHSLLKRSTEFSMLRAIGWSRQKIILVLLCEIGVLSLVPVIPVFLLMGLWSNTLNWVDGFILIVVNLLIISIGYYSGTRKALWQSPRAGLAGEGGQGSTKRLFPIHSVLGYVLHQLLRRPLRFGLMLLSLVLSTMMVLLFVATQQSLSDFLFLSFLGEVVDLQLKPYQTAFLVLGIVFTISVVIMLIFLNLIERQKEFYIMRSIGWPIKKVQRYLLIESGVVGVLGGVLGTIAGYSLLTYFSTLWLPAWVSVLSIVFPLVLLNSFTWILYRFLGNSHFLRKSID